MLDLPPANDDGSFNANIVNVWQMPLEDAGLLGADKGKGGKYLILPPGYADKVTDGYIALQSDTFGGYMLFRANLKSHSGADVAKSIDYGKRIKVYPLAQASNPAPTIFTDAKDVTFDSTIRYDASFFEHLDRIVQSEPWLQRDRAMIDPLKSLGIEKGKPFKPDDATKALLTAATREAGAWLEAKYDAGLPPFFSATSRWTFPAPPDLVKAAQEAYADPNLYPVDNRGMAYSYAYIGIKRLGVGQFYLISIRDKEGQSFDGGNTYRLTVPANPPVEQYWSVTAYDRQTHALIKNMPRASRSSQIPGTAEERRRLRRHLLWASGTGGQGCKLGADRSGAEVRTDVPYLRADQGTVRKELGAFRCRENRQYGRNWCNEVTRSVHATVRKSVALTHGLIASDGGSNGR